MKKYLIYLSFVIFLICIACKQRQESQTYPLFEKTSTEKPICQDVSQFNLKGKIDLNRLEAEMKGVSFNRLTGFGDALNEISKLQIKDKLIYHTGLEQAEGAIILSFTDKFYRELNKSLYQRDCKKFEYVTAVLGSGLNKVVSLSGTLYRGGSIFPDELENYKVGNEIIAPAFLSTSPQKNTALGFVNNAFFEIISENGPFISWLSAWSEEEEVLFPAGTKFLIQDVSETKPGDQASVKNIKLKQITTNRRAKPYIPLGLKQYLAGRKDEKLEISSTFSRLFTVNSAGGKYENGSCQFTKIKNNDGVIYKFFDEDTIIEIPVPKDLTVKKFPIDNPVIDPTVEIFAISRFPKSPNLQVRYLYQNEAEKEKKTEVLEKLLTLILDDSLQIESMEILELDSRKQFACKFENKIPIVSP